MDTISLFEQVCKCCVAATVYCTCCSSAHVEVLMWRWLIVATESPTNDDRRQSVYSIHTHGNDDSNNNHNNNVHANYCLPIINHIARETE